MSLSKPLSFPQSAWRGKAIFAFPPIEELTTKNGHERKYENSVRYFSLII